MTPATHRYVFRTSVRLADVVMLRLGWVADIDQMPATTSNRYAQRSASIEAAILDVAMPIATVASIALLQIASLPDTRVPRPLVELRAPQGSEVTADYLCPGTNVKLHISAGYGWVKVTSYSPSETSKLAANLKAWNEALHRLAGLSYYTISCQASNEQLVSIHGVSRTPGERETWVSARFTDGDLIEVTVPK